MQNTDNYPDCYAQADAIDKPVLVYICRPEEIDSLTEKLTENQNTYLQARKFKAKNGQLVYLADTDGALDCVVFGVGELADAYCNSEILAGELSARLETGIYKFAKLPNDWDKNLASIFWGLGAYKFGRYKRNNKNKAVLMLDDNAQAKRITNQTNACWLGRDLINTPAADMGPVAIQEQCQNLANKYGASFEAIIGDELLSRNYPMIHAVGRAAAEEPRLLMLKWGNEKNPSLALIGKGISFDTGGLDIKSAAGMRIMKKDMGGAAHALALAQMIMAAGLEIDLRVYLAVAENAVAGNAFRPGDILSSRKGISVEIDNTDAEGRLVLGDALTRACEDDAKLLIDFATLTGAARVALGPTLPPFFCNRENLVTGIMQAGEKQKDPVWPMPLWAEYNSMLNSPIADMKNAGGSFAGAVTAALFLQKFIDGRPWIHFDVYGWNPQSAPARPKGGEIFAVRAVFDWLKQNGLSKV